MATGLTSVFTPGRACLSTYIFDRWASGDGDGENTTVTDVVGAFRFRSTVISDGTTFSCMPQGGVLSGTPSFSPGLSCPLNWVMHTQQKGKEGTTGLCCPMFMSVSDFPVLMGTLCQSELQSGTIWYQSEKEEATDYTKMTIQQHLNPESKIVMAVVSVTPIMMVWEPSDITSTGSPVVIATYRSTSAATGTSLPHSDSSLSDGAVAAISASAALTVILLVAVFLFYRAWSRRRSNATSQPEANAENTSRIPRPSDELKAEMEDPVSARELFKQSGAFRGKPELGNEVNRTHLSSPREAGEINPHSSQDEVADDSVPGDGDSIGLGHSYPAELE